MKTRPKISTLLLDIGGVLLSDGWTRQGRGRAAKAFHLDALEMEERHHLTYDTYEEGKIDLKEYLNRVVFYKKRSFSHARFRSFMFAQSFAHPEMIGLVRGLKREYGLKIVVLSNEAAELNEYRVRKFGLRSFVDFFISSCFVHLRKPDADIFRMALDLAQVPARQALYIENTPLFVEIAQGLGIQSILHRNFNATRAELAALGFQTGPKTGPFNLDKG